MVFALLELSHSYSGEALRQGFIVQVGKRCTGTLQSVREQTGEPNLVWVGFHGKTEL